MLSTAFFVSRYDFALLALALPDIQRELGVREDQLGALPGSVPSLLSHWR